MLTVADATAEMSSSLTYAMNFRSTLRKTSTRARSNTCFVDTPNEPDTHCHNEFVKTRDETRTISHTTKVKSSMATNCDTVQSALEKTRDTKHTYPVSGQPVRDRDHAELAYSVAEESPVWLRQNETLISNATRHRVHFPLFPICISVFPKSH